MSTSPPRGVRRADHRAYAVTCPREACKAPPWHACVTFVGAASSQEPRSLEEPHRERVDAERAEGTTAKQRTPPLLDFEDLSGDRNGLRGFREDEPQ